MSIKPTYLIAWQIDTWGAREWYDGGKRIGYDTCLDPTNAYIFDTVTEAWTVARQLGARPVLKIDYGKSMPAEPEIWALREGETELKRVVWSSSD